MVNVNVKAPDIGFQAPDSKKTGSTGIKNTQSDQFKKLLQGKQDENQDAGTTEVSKDTEPEKTEAPKEPEEGKGEEVKDETAEETAGTDDSQARGLLAAYQMSQGMRPEVLTAEPEVVIEMPEAVQAETGVTPVETAGAGEMITEAAAEQMPVQPETAEAVKPAEVHVQTEAKPQEAVQVKAPEVQEAAPERVEAAPVRREAVRTQSTGEENQSQANDYQAEQSAAAPVAQTPVKNIQEDVPREVTTIHVAQPEELPDKLTDQIVGKMQEGVQSFEIEIEPENLGKIAVKIMYEDGQATVSILCTEKKALDVLGNHAREIGGIIDRNLGGETKIFVEKQEPDYLNRNNDENQQGRQDGQEQQKESGKKQEADDSEQFLQKLRLGLTI